MNTNRGTTQAMDRCRNGATLRFDLPGGEIAIEAEREDVYYSFFVTHADGSTEEVEGIQVRRLLVNHECRIE